MTLGARVVLASATCAALFASTRARAFGPITDEIRYTEIQSELAGANFSGGAVDRARTRHDVNGHGADIGVFSPRFHGIGFGVGIGGPRFMIVEEVLLAWGHADGTPRDPNAQVDVGTLSMMRVGLEPRWTFREGGFSVSIGTAFALGHFLARASGETSCASHCGGPLAASAWQAYAIPRIGFAFDPWPRERLGLELGAYFGMDPFRMPGWDLGLSVKMRMGMGIDVAQPPLEPRRG